MKLFERLCFPRKEYVGHGRERRTRKALRINGHPDEMKRWISWGRQTGKADGKNFPVKDFFSLLHLRGHKIQAHVHKPVPREVKYTQETLFVKKGLMKINFYNEQKEYLNTRALEAGDVILHVSGGHDFEMLEDPDMIEVKQGPYAGVEDKERFEARVGIVLCLKSLNTLDVTRIRPY